MTDRTDESVAHMGPSGDEPQSAGAPEMSGPRLARSSMASPSSAVDEGETDTPVSDGPAGDVPGANERAESRDVGDEDADLGDDTGRGDTGHGDASGQVSARSHVNTHNVSLPSTSSTSTVARGAVSYAVGPFSVREVSLLGIWAVAFLVSFFPDNNVTGAARLLVGGSNVWLSGLWWIPAVALPTIAVGLLVLRRLSPQGIRRVGSLGIDQFASVAFSVAAFVWVAWLWETVSIAIDTGGWVRSWVVWVEAVLMLAGVVLTVAAPFLPPFAGDFADREEVPAHRNARPVRPVVPRPATARPARRSTDRRATDAASAPHVEAAASPGDYVRSTEGPRPAPNDPPTSVLPAVDHSHEGEDAAVAPDHANPSDDHPTDVITGIHHSPSESAHPATQAFWALAPVDREVVDDYGTPIFRIGPSAWALVIEDRGETFVIRHDDGRIGYLHDVSGITRG
ncbi:hypothetical protein [Microbacterium testaceum]|uniref:hypothetical protein n=1 Tax=Microbacterium testaceum TaxID=2033 RepID=UPI000B15B8F0|nr:hypothetical protein [Microbacterium testaceum]